MEENLTKLLLLNDILINSPVLYRNYRIKLTFDVFIIERSEVVVMFNVSLLAILSLLDRYVSKILIEHLFCCSCLEYNQRMKGLSLIRGQLII